jgi:hypothetical protein
MAQLIDHEVLASAIEDRSLGTPSRLPVAPVPVGSERAQSRHHGIVQWQGSLAAFSLWWNLHDPRSGDLHPGPLDRECLVVKGNIRRAPRHGEAPESWNAELSR